MSLRSFTRRQFLVMSGTFAASAVAGTHAGAQRTPARSPTSVVIYRLSLRGRRGSNAAKKHNANLRFATQSAADSNRAHPGDHSRIVRLIVSADEFHRLFPSPDSLVADLRKLRRACVGDCNGDGQVTINELLTMVNGALGTASVSACPAGDASNDGQITIDEILTAVNNALQGCGSR